MKIIFEVISKQSDLKYRISVYIDGKDKKKKDPIGYGF